MTITFDLPPECNDLQEIDLFNLADVLRNIEATVRREHCNGIIARVGAYVKDQPGCISDLMDFEGLEALIECTKAKVDSIKEERKTQQLSLPTLSCFFDWVVKPCLSSERGVDAKELFAEEGLVLAFWEVWESLPPSDSSSCISVLRACQMLCSRCDKGKWGLVKRGAVDNLLSILEEVEEGYPEEGRALEPSPSLFWSSLGLLNVLCTDDDRSAKNPACLWTRQHITETETGALDRTRRILKRAREALGPFSSRRVVVSSLVRACCSGSEQVTLKVAEEDGFLGWTVDFMERIATHESPDWRLLSHLVLLIRQWSFSDAMKEILMREGGGAKSGEEERAEGNLSRVSAPIVPLKMIRLLSQMVKSEKGGQVVEHVWGFIANLTLRKPENVDVLSGIAGVELLSLGAQSCRLHHSAAPLRQLFGAFRNFSKSPNLRSRMLEEDEGRSVTDCALEVFERHSRPCEAGGKEQTRKQREAWRAAAEKAFMLLRELRLDTGLTLEKFSKGGGAERGGRGGEEEGEEEEELNQQVQ